MKYRFCSEMHCPWGLAWGLETKKTGKWPKSRQNHRKVVKSPKIRQNSPKLAENWPKLAENWPELAENWPKLAENLTKTDPAVAPVGHGQWYSGIQAVVQWDTDPGPIPRVTLVIDRPRHTPCTGYHPTTPHRCTAVRLLSQQCGWVRQASFGYSGQAIIPICLKCLKLTKISWKCGQNAKPILMESVKTVKNGQNRCFYRFFMVFTGFAHFGSFHRDWIGFGHGNSWKNQWFLVVKITTFWRQNQSVQNGTFWRKCLPNPHSFY